MIYEHKILATKIARSTCIAMLFLSMPALGQDFGQPLIQNYTAKDYPVNSPIWSIAQDARGLMYFATNDGVLQFDGRTWRLIKLDNNSAVRTLSTADDGRVYVTGSSDFGYLAPDSVGRMAFHSLRAAMPAGSGKFGEVWDVVAAASGIYFKTQDKVFHWDGARITIIPSLDSYRLYVVDDRVYARDHGNGLMEISAGAAHRIPSGEAFAEIGVWNMLPLDDKILVTTAEDGLYLYDGHTFSRFESAADQFLIDGFLYNTCELASGRFAFATQRNGVAILDRDGRAASYLTKEDGLPVNVIYDVFQDTQGGLWLCTEQGISRVEISAPFSMLPRENIADATIETLYRFQDNLFAGIVLGTRYFDASQKIFQPVHGTDSFGNSYVSIGQSLFATDIEMLFAIDKNFNAKELFLTDNGYMFQSAIDSNIIYVVDRIGLWMFRHQKGVLTHILETIPVEIELASLAEDGDGTLWIATYYEGVYQVKSSAGNVFSSTDVAQITFTHYDKEKGPPGNTWQVYTIAGKTRFATDAGLFQFAPEAKTFVRDSLLGKEFANGINTVAGLKIDQSGRVWVWAKTPEGHELGKVVQQDNGALQWHPDPQLRRLDLKNLMTFYPEFDQTTDADIIWISTDDGLIRYKPNGHPRTPAHFDTFIRQVTVNADSLIYGGAVADEPEKSRVLTSENNNVLFRFSATSYDKPEATHFQYRLNGYEKSWSPWTLETQKAYTNLADGEYEFHVRAQNVYGAVGTTDSFSFSILPAWYWSWWAYAIYGLLISGFLMLAHRWELRRVHKKHLVQLQLLELDKLKELDQLKSQFFANISHEFRTPLTLILGQLDSVQSPRLDKQDLSKLQVAYRNARRLLRLINELLDLSKLEAGGMQLRAETHNLVSFLKVLVSSFESLAVQKAVELKFVAEETSIPVKFEPEKMEKVFYNLLSNAIKFSHENGVVEVTIVQQQATITVTVADTGIGLSAAELPLIFNRFYQVDSSHTREHEGSGIGLALAKELIELHGGHISASSDEQKGTIFTVQLPVSQANERLQEWTYAQAAVVKNANEAVPSVVDARVSDKSEIILIVEDNTDVRAYIREQLQADYTIVEAEDGEQGVATAQDIMPDLIITDLMMPKLDGYQLSARIRAHEKTSHIPIVMLTARADLDDKIEGLETGVDSYLIKPFNARELKARIRNLIQQRKDLRKQFREATIIKPSEVTVTAVDQVFLENVIASIEQHISDEHFNVKMLADHVHMSVSQINRKLGALIDQPAGQLIRSMRLQRAADLLQKNAGSVAEICYQVGFSDQANFTRAFKKQFGVTPGGYGG